MTAACIHDQCYDVYSWDEFGKVAFELSRSILERGEVFDRIIALAKGGIEIARPIADYLGVKEISSVQIEFYTGIGTTAKTPVITQDLPIRIRGERVLIIDDIADSGETLVMATNYLGAHGAVDIQTATLITKPWTKAHPTYSVAESKSWVIFPWEVRESIEILSSLWSSKGDSKDKIHAQLLELGFAKDQIDLFLES